MTRNGEARQDTVAGPAVARIIGRYALHGVIASGGMAVVHLGQLLGLAGFARTVAVKRLHPQYARDPEFVSMLIDEARLAARINHPNVVATLDVVALQGELLVVMEYVHGESMAALMRKALAAGTRIPTRVLLSMICGMLYGLHAAHEAVNERGEPLGIVHRDVSPQNVLVGVDGIARVLDFGIAKAAGRLQSTREGQLKGKIRYMAPEQLLSRTAIDRRTDVYAASVVLWESLTGQRLFDGDSDWQIAHQIMQGTIPPPSSLAPSVPPQLDAVVMRGLERIADKRFATAFDLAAALETIGELATQREVGQWVQAAAHESLAKRASMVAQIEGNTPREDSSMQALALAVQEPGGDVSRISVVLTDPIEPTAAEVQAEPQRASGPPRTKAPSGGRVGARAMAVGATALVGGLAAVALSLSSAPDPAAMRPWVFASLSPLLAYRMPEPAAPPASEPAPVEPVSPAAVVSAPSSPPLPAPVPAAITAVPRPVRAPPAPAPPAPSTDCKPPYYYDSAGVKHLKRHCL